MSDIDTTGVDSLKALDPKRPIREADIPSRLGAEGQYQSRCADALADEDIEALFRISIMASGRRRTYKMKKRKRMPAAALDEEWFRSLNL